MAMDALGNFVDVAAVPPLLTALNKNHPDYQENVTQAALRSLIKLCKKLPMLATWITVEQLEQLLKGDISNWQEILKLACILHLCLPPKILLDTLTKHLYIRLEDILQLFTMLGPDAPITELLQLLNSPISFVSKNAAIVLLQLHKYVPHQAIIDVLQLHKDAAEHFIPLVELLLRQGHPVDSQLVLTITNIGLYRSNTIAFKSLMRCFHLLGKQAPLAQLLGILYDDEEQAEQRSQMLRYSYEQITPDLLLNEARHRSADEVRAIQMLEMMQKDAPINLFMHILQDPIRDRQVRIEALFSLTHLGINVPLEYFVLGQVWCFYGVDDAMVETMTRLGAQAPIAELIALLGHPNNWVRSSASSSLQNLASYMPVDLLLPALHSSNAKMRASAAFTMGAFSERAPNRTIIFPGSK
ncbi:HEAT repeat domain-containing protein [Dictyobacter kobayashii]